jgi:hypothetical protein
MNTQMNTKTRLSLFSPHFVTLLIGVVMALAMLVVGSPSVQAQTTTTAADPVDSTITVTTKGTVNDPNGSVTVSGSIVVNCRRVIDTTSTTAVPLVLLDFDFSQLKGTSGTGVKTLAYTTGDNHASEIRPLQASDTIIVTSPYYDTTKGPLAARSMLVTATLNFDTTTGKLTTGSISIGNNVVTTAAVGTVVAAQ